MKTVCALLAATTVIASCSSSKQSQASVASPTVKQLTPRDILERSKSSIARILVENSQGQSAGTGFLVAPDILVTNLHVILTADRVLLEFADESKYEVNSLVAFNKEKDLALLKLPTRKGGLVLADSSQVAAGDPVIAIGNPLGVFDYTISDGLVSGVRPVRDNLTVLQISAPISQGSSGGPLFNTRGEVIGVATAIVTAGQNLNFAIPSNYVQELLREQNPITLSALQNQLLASIPKRSPRQRNIPQHTPSILDECTQEASAAALGAINSAISSGAPLYNQGNHEACFRIYEGTAQKLQQESSCPAVGELMGDGLAQAKTLSNYTDKAWAMRDAFDGLTLVIRKKYGNVP